MRKPQAVLAPLSRAATVLVATVGPDPSAAASVRELCGELGGLVRSVGFRDLESSLSCVIGFGARVWPRIFDTAAPPLLHEFETIEGPRHSAVATAGDIVFHLRAARSDLCFELAIQILARLGPAVTPVDEVQGFRFFDFRDLLGFVDGTENPVDAEAAKAALVPEDDPHGGGGSFLVVQKYLHDLAAWNSLSVAEQARIIGRDKLSNVELGDAEIPTSAHRLLTTVADSDGRELKIIRDNMPFGSPSANEFGTCFIGYAATPDVIERMLRRMFIGEPPGNYDRILDFSTAVTGGLFFVPSLTLLEQLSA